MIGGCGRACGWGGGEGGTGEREGVETGWRRREMRRGGLAVRVEGVERGHLAEGIDGRFQLGLSICLAFGWLGVCIGGNNW